ncbi:aspartyl/asparaginyl beta-hydroxylase domain-containing protein [Sphingomonas sp. SUN019]|uniref:aspartyl/asparaginyl beta-hydroxylase domain-containing protein n=1 Tax=Sphingomonas sp. SUN019 TaxID=2937788 RepID=UPI002164C441|nr:aspartyl/asparaginyl beta-hydroxylase domain-containing protein [Sphingomonas sp. SUN019]UVO49884.1 aspartyl/asparaginyl beta-hydroxylase domain-containing protein [Sphingomonas sp. SUN019]
MSHAQTANDAAAKKRTRTVSTDSKQASAALWQDRDVQARADPVMVPDLNVISGAPVSGVAMAPEKGRPFIIRFGKHLRGLFDRLIASSSLVSNEPVLDMRDFAWTQVLRDNWQAIRDEALAVALRGNAAPSLSTISPDHRSIAEVDKWRSFFLWGYGFPIEDNLARCPRTQAVVEQIPGLNSAFFSILAPGTHIPQHRGVTKGLITCHLGLIVPRDGDVRMRVHDRIVRWAEGETLVFDDTYQHEVWNDTSGTRVVLLVQFERPLRNPGKWFADFFLGFVRRSAFVQEARANISSWNAAVKQMDV